MASELKSNSRRRKRYRAKKELGRKRLVILIGAILGLYVVFVFGVLQWKIFMSDRDLDRIKSQNRMIERKIDNLTIKRKKLQNIDYVKNVARAKLYLMESNEVPIKIRGGAKPTP